MNKIELSHANYYKNVWLELRDGGSGQWLYAVSNGMCFIFINIIDLVDYCGKEADVLFTSSVRVVDLKTINVENIIQSLKSSGINDINDLKDSNGKIHPLVLAEYCLDYGSYAPMWDDSGGKVTERFRYGGHDEKHPAFRKLRSDARKYAETLFDEMRRNNELQTKVVNAIGSTAEEYMSGNIWAALRRSKNNPTPEQEIVLKMYANVDKTLGGESIPEDLKG